MYRQRFGLTGHPLPKNVQGKTFFDKSPGFKKVERAFRQLIADPGLGAGTSPQEKMESRFTGDIRSVVAHKHSHSRQRDIRSMGFVYNDREGFVLRR